MFNSLLKMVKEEQELQNGDFISFQDLDSYWKKLLEKAELITHSIEGCNGGFIAFYCNDVQKEESFITLMLVNSDFRGRNIASNLVEAVLSITRSRGFKRCALEVKKNNNSAIGLYEKMGFSLFEEREFSNIMKVNV
ncbi:GNAT family N-acetyltransferase [Pseudomonas sp. MPFS]|uniref:GNAT family N-acetyltransferase n=1 Tax=Pseudomonas sp. MPFS TaxID=2795724 RepID=UPI001F1390DE|nr:GNAT family N-acetyltransferase [Pseudomonas sp. MPFS]UMZ14031.1 GNAT family N-acetyltransferase [Pseudomonas sp. MPFS]